MIKFLVFLLLLSCSETLPTPNENTLIKITQDLAKCMVVVNACDEARNQVDKEIQAIFDLQKEDFCE